MIKDTMLRRRFITLGLATSLGLFGTRAMAQEDAGFSEQEQKPQIQSAANESGVSPGKEAESSGSKKFSDGFRYDIAITNGELLRAGEKAECPR